MAFLDRDDASIHYEITGDDGPVLLLTHGFSSSGDAFAANSAAIVDVGYRLIRWDLRGHGRTDAGTDPSAYTVELALGDMDALLDLVGADRAIVGGHSLGGFLSLGYRIVHPDRVGGLVLIDTGPGYRDDEARAGWNRFVDRDAVQLTTRHSPEVAARMMLTAEGILKQRDSSVIDSLPAIDVPTLVIVGEDDKAFRGGSEYMAAKIDGAQLVVIEGAGHSPNVTHREVFDAALVKFLVGLEVQ